MNLEIIVQVVPDIWGCGKITYDWPFLEPCVDLKVKSNGHLFFFLHENIPLNVLSAIFFPFFFPFNTFLAEALSFIAKNINC